MRPFGEAQSKAMRAYAQSGQYHTIVESRVRLSLFKMNFKVQFLQGTQKQGGVTRYKPLIVDVMKTLLQQTLLHEALH